jgi:hypothetical protein
VRSTLHNGLSISYKSGLVMTYGHKNVKYLNAINLIIVQCTNLIAYLDINFSVTVIISLFHYTQLCLSTSKKKKKKNYI